MKYVNFAIKVSSTFYEFLMFFGAIAGLLSSVYLFRLAQTRIKQIKDPKPNIWYDETFCEPTLYIIKAC